jgi:hypothetical protein
MSGCTCADDLTEEDLWSRQYGDVCAAFERELADGITANLIPFSRAMDLHLSLTTVMYDFEPGDAKEYAEDVDVCVDRVRRSVEALARHCPRHARIGEIRDSWIVKLEITAWYFGGLRSVFEGKMRPSVYDKMQWFSTFVSSEIRGRRVSMRRVERLWSQLVPGIGAMKPMEIRERVQREFNRG